MQCSVCGKRLPLLRQLGGGAFCSEEHKLEHAARKAGPGAAAAVATQPLCAHSEALPESGLPAPIPRFSDVILTRRRPRARETMGFKGAGGIGRPPGAVAPGQARAIAEDLSGLSPSLSLTARSPQREAAPRLTVADAAAIGIGPEEEAFHLLASSSVPFLASRTELHLRRAALAPALRGVALCEDRPALLIAGGGSACRRDAPDAVLRMAWSLRLRADVEGPAHRGLRAGEAAFHLPPDPELSRSASRFPEYTWQPRQRLRSPGARQYGPTLAGLSSPGEIGQAFDVADSSSFPAPPHFRSAMSYRDLNCLAAGIEPRLQKAPACEEPAARPSALCGNTVPQDGSRPVIWLAGRLFAYAGPGLPSPPGFKAREAASPAPPDPESFRSVPWAPDSLRPPRYRFRGPRARQQVPTHSGLSVPGEIGFAFAPADSSSFPAPPHFRSAISCRELDRLVGAIEPRLQNGPAFAEAGPTPAVLCGNAFPPGDPRLVSWLHYRLSVHAGMGLPSPPGFRAREAVIAAPLNPKPSESAPWSPDSLRPPRYRFRGPRGRQSAPTLAGLRSCKDLSDAPTEAGGNACPTWWDKRLQDGGAGSFACRPIFSQLLSVPGIGHGFASTDSSSFPAPPHVRSAISCREPGALPAALSGNIFPRDESRPVSWLHSCLFAHASSGLLSPPGFRAQEAVIAAPLNPKSSEPAPWSPDSLRPPRYRFRGPAAHRFSPGLAGLHWPGAIQDTLAAANSPALSGEAGFRFAAPPVELGSSAARIANDLPGVTPSADRALFPSAERGCISPRDECSSTLRFGQYLPGFAGWERLNAPAITGLRPWAEIEELLAASDGHGVPAEVQFRVAPALPSFDGSSKPPVFLPPADRIGEAVSSSDWGNAPTAPLGSIPGPAIVLPHLNARLETPAGTDGAASPEPRVGDFDVTATVNAFRTLNGIGKAYTLAVADAPASPAPSVACAHILAMPPAIMGPELSVAEPALLRLLLRIPNPRGTPDLGEFEVHQSTRTPAGFAAELTPDPLPGVCSPMHASADFSLYPVWLPELFALPEPQGGLRTARGFNPHSMSAAAGNSEFQHDSGPGFSGQLGLPLQAAAVNDFAETRPPIFNAQVRTPSLPQPGGGEPFWQTALDRWRTVPAVARGVALALPLTALAVFYVPWPALPADTPNWSAVAVTMRDRATVDVKEDFQSGLTAWTGTPGWEGSWSHPQDGSAQPGRLALYTPTLSLRDYQLDLQGYIESKGLSFVFRAADLNNYYAVKFVVKKPGPLPTVALVRYAVIGGRAEPKTETAIPLYLRDDTLYKALVTVEGEHFSVSLNGQLVDAWSDSRLKSGGVGLFADKGEVAHLRSVQVVDHQDFLGWLCSQVSAWTADRRTLGVKHE